MHANGKFSVDAGIVSSPLFFSLFYTMHTINVQFPFHIHNSYRNLIILMIQVERQNCLP